MRLSPTTLAVLAAVAAGLLTLWLWPRAAKSPEDEIRALVAACVEAAEAKQAGPIADAIADDFKGPSGSGRAEVKQLIAYRVLRDQETVAVFNPKLSVTVTGPDSGRLSGKFVFARSKAKSFEQLPEGAAVSAYEIEAEVKKREGKWLFVSATYQEGFR